MSSAQKLREQAVAHIKATNAPNVRTEMTLITPELAMELLEFNTLNRPLSDGHVKRIARQITEGKWKTNGDTIKISDSKKVVDGQHRLWAIAEAKVAVWSLIAYGVEEDAFNTVDTIRKNRSGADILSRHGVGVARNVTASALAWLLRYQRGVLQNYRAPANKIENSDIEDAWEKHPGIAKAVERCGCLRRLANVSIMAFVFYLVSNRDPYLAESLVTVLHTPGNVGVDHPFMRLRFYLTQDRTKDLDPVETIAVTFKALNAVKLRKEVKRLTFQRHGATPEKFPELEV